MNLLMFLYLSTGYYISADIIADLSAISSILGIYK